MKSINFKSINIIKVEEPTTRDEEKKYHMEFDSGSVKDHKLDLSITQIVSDKSWILNFFLTTMIVSALFALVYGGIVLGAGIKFSGEEGNFYWNIYLVSFAAFFLIIWMGLSVPGAIKNKKQECVEETRGNGNWKIVDDNKWEQFSRLLTISNQE